MNTRSLFPALSLLASLLINVSATGESNTPLDGISAISESDIRSSVIAFVNTTSSPGLEGATLSVDTAERDSEQWRSSLGFNAEVTLKNHIFNAFWGLGLVGGSLNDKIQLTADNGKPVSLNLTHDIVSLRGSFGEALGSFFAH